MGGPRDKQAVRLGQQAPWCLQTQGRGTGARLPGLPGSWAQPLLDLDKGSIRNPLSVLWSDSLKQAGFCSHKGQPLRFSWLFLRSVDAGVGVGFAASSASLFLTPASSTCSCKPVRVPVVAVARGCCALSVPPWVMSSGCAPAPSAAVGSRADEAEAPRPQPLPVRSASPVTWASALFLCFCQVPPC